jgi:demethylmenaquinone methyltransferase/2-methoxy-6-polyprenyl-1,4-benzoquinol methylase
MSNPIDSNAQKKTVIGTMFSRISRKYNLANDILSLGLHRLWKNEALRILDAKKTEKLLDLCCGTADFLIKQGFGIGADLSYKMLTEARKKISNPLVCADGEMLPFKEKSLNKIIMGFGIRNIPNPSVALFEIYRVLAAHGKLVILEFSKPRGKIFSKFYFFYLYKILPRIGGWISKDPQAYQYLANTIGEFPDGEDFINLMKKANFKNLRMQRLSFGIASIYIGEKNTH